MINDPSSIINVLSVNVARPGGGKDIYIAPADIVLYLRDPDGFAAEHFGLTKLEYIEWVTLDGAALCAARKRGGDLCRNVVSSAQLDPVEWKKRHRRGCCHAHGGTARA